MLANLCVSLVLLCMLVPGSDAFQRKPIPKARGLYSTIVDELDSPRLKKARLRVAEAQGIIPIGASEQFLEASNAVITTVKSQSKVREISWRVAEPSVRYDPDAAAAKLFSQPFRWLGRNIEIFVPLAIFSVEVLCDIAFNNEEKNRQLRANKLLDIISAQSPALIKAGQALASRSDLLPKEYLDALQKLQDRCPAYPTEQALALFKQELGMEFADAFVLDDSIEQPVAAASIGQVYRGTMRSNGARVAVKIQRPNCEDAIAIDLFVMRWYATQMQSILKLLKRDIDVVSVIDDFGELIYREIDYRAEAVNAQRFAELYSNIPDVFVPKVYTDLSTSKILTMEWVDGAKLNDKESMEAMGLSSSKLLDTLVQCSLRQMLENGFFHADPHAGNLLAMPSGKLCYLDFGMVSYVEASQRYSIIEAIVHMVNRDFVSLAELYKRMGFIPMDVETAPIVEALEAALPDVLNAAVGDFNFKNIITKLGDVMYKFPFSLPPFYISIIRCLGVLEGLAIQIDSDFRIISDAYPYIASRLLTDPSEELQSALQQLVIKDGKLRWDRLEELMEEASYTSDYDITMAADQMIEYLSTNQSKPIRDLLAPQIVGTLTELEEEAVVFLSSSRTRQDIQSSLLAVLSGRDQTNRTLSTLVDRMLDSIQAVEGGPTIDGHVRMSASGSGGLKVLKLLRESNGLDREKLVVILRKILREPPLQEVLGDVVSDLSEKLLLKWITRAMALGQRPVT